MSKSNVLIYLLRRDLRATDNPILHHLASTTNHGFTHLLPVYVFPAHQIEVSGLLKDGVEKSPYPEAKSPVANYWRCGPHRVKFVAQSCWNLKESLESLGSGLLLRVGMFADVLPTLIKGLKEKQLHVGAVWMTGDVATEEKQDEQAVAKVCKAHEADFKIWIDEKYFIDDRDLGISIQELPDIFTTYLKSTDPLREKPRKSMPKPAKSSLPPFPNHADIPDQSAPFAVPDDYEKLEAALVKPVRQFLPEIPRSPEDAINAHPFRGGEDHAMKRLTHLVRSGRMVTYKDTRNGLIDTEYSTKLSAYLSLGCISARQIHEALLSLEDGTDESYKDAAGYGGGQCDGTRAVRFELLWRDYMRLCTQKFTYRLFRLEGFQGDDAVKGGHEQTKKWKSASKAQASTSDNLIAEDLSSIIARFNAGTTGMGFIDASQRELIHTGYTSNRARQNVASFLAKHLDIDWRYGAEWYEMMLVDYDVSSNWGNWQYVAGVGNDPRGPARIFNPVKQAFEYDKDGSYVRMWVPEVAKLTKLENVFQAWTASHEELRGAGLEGNIMVTDPIKRIDFSVDGKPRNAKNRPYGKRGGRGGNGGGGQGRRPNSVDGGFTTTAVIAHGLTNPGGFNQMPSARGYHTGPSPQRGRPGGPWFNKPAGANDGGSYQGDSYRGGNGRGYFSGRGSSSGRGSFRSRPYGRGGGNGAGQPQPSPTTTAPPTGDRTKA